ncbi:MAG TPA: hypothetical protein VEV17_15600 [Bryobacteraceae bacterium]|nr:hypothetical protein [Bryobacteraceae bacterium]
MSVSSQDLFVRRISNDIHVVAPRFHFLTGKTLERLHDGALLPFDFQLSIASGTKSNTVARAPERFLVSYDLWQERFSVVRLRDLRKSPLNLSAAAAEAWCVDNVVLPVSALPGANQLWARLEVRSVDQRTSAAPAGDAGISIISLVELFSRPPRPQQDHWSLESAAFHLAELTP